MNKIILYIATSKDGFIADQAGGVDWLPQPKNEAELKEVGYKDLMAGIDTILMGSKSYQQILEFGQWRWPDKQTYVLTSQQLESDKSYLKFTHDTPAQIVSKLKNRQSGQDVWLLGGAELASSFEGLGLIDEIILTIVPHILGQGIPLGINLQNFKKTSEKLLSAGMVQQSFKREVE